MLVYNRAEYARRQYVRMIKKIICEKLKITDDRWINQDILWHTWLSHQGREWRDFRSLLSTDVLDGFKARALACLFAPSHFLSPFDRKSSGDGNYISLWFKEEEGKITFGDLSPQMQDVFLKMVEFSASTIKHSSDSCFVDPARHYNWLIIQALEKLPEDDPRAQDLFQAYSLLKDSEYEGFNSMLFSSVPEKWKKSIDLRMRAVMLAEVADKVTARALPCYVNCLETFLHTTGERYGAALHVSQVEFVLKLQKSKKESLFQKHHLVDLISFLQEGEHKILRHDLARILLFADHGAMGPFFIGSADRMNLAKAMLAEFGTTDPPLAAVLADLIKAGVLEIAEREQAAAARKARDDAVLNALK